ncbi:hypothetical protein [Cryobacterium sp. TMT2-17-1]|uniref:hypothetical protein n=1 Tax=Cryobacterium sp. TMT2-17-1 TaxID=1259248 RepID=UPI001F548347|nr:hypothetical protein [Cryobacterium sp. TMT2-17-1]
MPPAPIASTPSSPRCRHCFTPYTELSEAEIKALADQMDALGEPLNQRTATLVL